MLNNFVNRFRRSNAVHKPTEDVVPVPNADADSDEVNPHQWSRPLEFVLSLISNSVGLGNVWRFPYLAAQSGGGAFLIPYFVLYFLIGAPLYFMELALGQFTSRGPATGYVLARGWRGIGYAMIINSALATLYYNVLIAWALFYFILSFRKKLIWSECGHWWNTARCFKPGSEPNLCPDNETLSNLTDNLGCQQANSTEKVTATEEFYYRLLLNKSSSFDEFGVPGLYMSLLLLLAWFLICLCIIRGIQSSGKVAYFTAIFPYIVLLVLIIFTATLEGAGEGIRFYVVPRWELIGDFKIWQLAASQVFFSLGLSSGPLIAYSAANPFHNNFFKQMCIVVACDCFTGVFAGFAVFATIGFLATALGETVAKYAEASGPGLAFITYPEALSRMPASPFFSIIFFLMLLALGLGSQFASTDVLVTALMEFFPSYAKRRSILVIIICIAFFLFSLPFACPGGIYLFELFQEYTANISLVVLGFFEVIIVAYIYGFDRFMNDVYLMLNRRPVEYYLFFSWCIAAPLLTLILSVSNLLTSAPLVDKASGGFAEYEYPRWSNILGWFIFVFCVLPIPVVFAISYIEQYRRIAAERQIAANASSNEGHIQTDDSRRTPLYLAALSANNLPAETWGPRRKANQVGEYAHLHPQSRNINSPSEAYNPAHLNEVITKTSTTNGIDNPTFDPNLTVGNDYNNSSDNRF